MAAFTKRHFAGNPAGVCFLSEWLPDAQMQAIAAENNLAETAFVIERNGYFDVRWMTPTVEVDLCGHATLASAYVIFHHLGRTGDRVRFQSRSGELTVARVEDRLVLDFPSQPPSSCELPEKLVQGLRAQPRSVWKGPDYLAVFDREQDIKALAPDFDMLAQLDARGTIVTALGDDCDFVSRFFAPSPASRRIRSLAQRIARSSLTGQSGSGNKRFMPASFPNAAANYFVRTAANGSASAEML